MADEWGHGDLEKARSFGWTTIGDEKDSGALELFWGEHPHSRSDNNIYARDDHGNIYGFNGHRPLIDITFRSYNYLKESHLSGDEIRKAGLCTILVDREPVYSFGYRDISWALRRADVLLVELGEHSSFILTQDGRKDLIGRKVYWDRTPAKIVRYLADQGCIIIDAEPGHKFPPPVYAIENDEENHDWEENETSIKDDILSSKIWWHRK